MILWGPARWEVQLFGLIPDSSNAVSDLHLPLCWCCSCSYGVSAVSIELAAMETASITSTCLPHQ